MKAKNILKEIKQYKPENMAYSAMSDDVKKTFVKLAETGLRLSNNGKVSKLFTANFLSNHINKLKNLDILVEEVNSENEPFYKFTSTGVNVARKISEESGYGHLNNLHCVRHGV